MSALSSAAPFEKSGYSRPDLAARFDDFYKRWKLQRELDLRSDSDSEKIWDELNTEGADITRAIVAVPATTFLDVVLKARTCALENNIDWTDVDHVDSLDDGQRAYRSLIDSIMHFAGIEALPGVETVSL